jgi:tryptophan synthase
MQPALVTYFTAGFPTPEETVDVLLAMEAGGAGKDPNCLPLSNLLTVCIDIIELGLPFTDPIADGPTIQKSNTVCLHSKHYPE